MVTKPIHKYGYRVLHWEGDKLFFKDRLLVQLIPSVKYENHFHLKFCWRDEPTPEFFNMFNAKENSMRISLYRLNYDTSETPVGASLVRLNIPAATMVALDG